MLLRAVEPRKDGSIAYSYDATWPFTWPDCLAFLHGLVSYDLITDHTRPFSVFSDGHNVTELVIAAGLNPSAASLPRPDPGVLVIGGTSRLMESELRFTLYHDEQECLLEAIDGPAMHESDRVFDRYMDNLEIIAHIERVQAGAPRDRGTHHAATLF